MEKQSIISSSKFISSTLENVILNSNINLEKLKELINILDKASKVIIIPVLKIQKKIDIKYDILDKDCNEIKDKEESVNKDLIKNLEEEKSDLININSELQSNKKKLNNNENMKLFYEHIMNNIDLFTKLINSEEYSKLIKGFDELIPDKEMFNEEEKEKEKEKEQIDSEKKSKENAKLKKSKKPSQKKNNKKSIKKLNNSRGKDKKNSQHIPRKKKKEIDLLELLQKEFPSNSYVQKVSKTFLSRRLNKKVIYRHIFYYKENDNIEENKLRSAGESTVYKYCKTIFKFENDEIRNTEKIDEMLGKELKQQFAKIDYENKNYIIGGKICCSLNELIERVFKQNLLKELSVIEATLEFYEFYEELVNEFNEKDKNVRIIFCDEKVLRHLREDWINLELVRDYIKQKKSESEEK